LCINKEIAVSDLLVTFTTYLRLFVPES
jgi:hypothetical protein